MEESLVLLDFWPSTFGMRVRIALAEKGLKYELKEESLKDKSPLLLEMNPLHKMVPVLIHNGKPICESLLILEYVDEVWTHKSPLLPSDPYQRSQTRFWVDYADKKIYSSGKRILMERGEEQEKAKKEFKECLKTLQRELGDKLYFAGESFGFMDVALVPYFSWFYTYESFGNFSVEAECPRLVAWAKRCMHRETVSKSLSDPHEVYGFALQLLGGLE
ncbi:LOW QUALITY PROTEIN: probable glutathione S-transferase parA [Diospyros lotus]|uniref:LOW QUALITY PROTEIN: probable glutathione S-transferase parA n=1 Tax=Diospyros lotus TaxID=55363 RepID=UPI00224E7CFE|nr:LOW QUALITY PROTEIN: probable glutathione S-transferase parA [Diospyros lotus]